MNLIALPILIPLLAASILLLIKQKTIRAILAFVAAGSVLLVNTLIFMRTLQGEVLVVQMASWPAPWGISLVADGLAGIMLLLSSLVGLLTVLFASSSLNVAPRHGLSDYLNQARERFFAHALLQFLFMGVNMSFLTGDLFNLFVAFEVMLVASYGLLLLGNELRQLREGFKYVVMNLIASAILVLGAGMAYGLFGSLNMADIALRLSEHGPDPRTTLVAAMLALAFATKAAIFPLGFWLPNAYPVPTAAVSAFFAALLTKVGAYALIRSFTLMFPQEEGLKILIFVLAGVTMLIGGLGFIARQRWRQALAFANVASIGYLIIGVFSGSTEGLSAALFYLTHSVIVIFTLFLIAALAEKIAGEHFRAEGHLNVYPWLGLAFFVSAIALSGIPPTSGFVGKYALIAALFQLGGVAQVIVAIIAVVTGFLLLYASMQIWRQFFWGDDDAVHMVKIPLGMRNVTALSCVLLISLMIFSGPMFVAAERAAKQLEANQAYIGAVFGSREVR